MGAGRADFLGVLVSVNTLHVDFSRDAICNLYEPVVAGHLLLSYRASTVRQYEIDFVKLKKFPLFL